jgi:hypothetical protein
MREKKRVQFLKDVAEAARRRRPKPRGRPSPENMTDEGRRLGLDAIRNAPKCRAIRRKGERCKNPAMRGATRCLKHGGRVEVPAHPHNIRRFFTCEEHQRSGYARSRETWDRLNLAEQREFLSMLPLHVARKMRLVLDAWWSWQQVRDQGNPAVSRFLRELWSA